VSPTLSPASPRLCGPCPEGMQTDADVCKPACSFANPKADDIDQWSSRIPSRYSLFSKSCTAIPLKKVLSRAQDHVQALTSAWAPRQWCYWTSSASSRPSRAHPGWTAVEEGEGRVFSGCALWGPDCKECYVRQWVSHPYWDTCRLAGTRRNDKEDGTPRARSGHS